LQIASIHAVFARLRYGNQREPLLADGKSQCLALKLFRLQNVGVLLPDVAASIYMRSLGR